VVTAGADQGRVRTPIDALKRGVVGPVEEVLHHARHCRESRWHPDYKDVFDRFMKE
jgi:hypothetical protein